MLIKFEGHSDDIVYVARLHAGKEDREEYSAYRSGDDLIRATFNVGGRLRVYAIYDGCWSFAAGMIEEDISLPGWDVYVTNGTNGYSAQLRIDTGDEPVFVGAEEGK